MRLKEYLRLLFKRHNDRDNIEIVEETPSKARPVMPSLEADPVASEPMVPVYSQEPIDEVAFSSQSDLETYVSGLTVPKETIERWISAGVLLPEEIRVAEKMVKIMRENDQMHLN